MRGSRGTTYFVVDTDGNVIYVVMKHDADGNALELSAEEVFSIGPPVDANAVQIERFGVSRNPGEGGNDA